MKTWKRRWFILTDNCLYYFEYTTVSELSRGWGRAVGAGWGPPGGWCAPHHARGPRGVGCRHGAGQCRLPPRRECWTECCEHSALPMGHWEGVGGVCNENLCLAPSG